MAKAYAKTIVISLTLFIVKYCLCIGNAADILFSHGCNYQRRTRGRGLIRHSLRQTLPVLKMYIEKQVFNKPFCEPVPGKSHISVTLFSD